MTEPTVLKLLGLPPVKPYTNSKATPMLAADPSLLMGLELEIEGVRDDPSELYVPGMYGTEDNSLRTTDVGRGWEFITKPATFSVTAYILETFFKKAALSQEKNYSERCSIHVHANVQDLTPSQLKSVCLLYQVFERLFYSFAGHDRDSNIFCVPWAETTITHKLIDNLLDQNLKSLRQWQKYTGLNLIPTQTQGTIEFRHLPGTCDLPRILDWLNMIGCLFSTARNIPFEEIKTFITSVNTTSEYKELVRRVFQQWERVFNMPSMETQLEEGVLDVKYMLAASHKKGVKVPTMVFDDLLPREGGMDAPAWLDAAEQRQREDAIRLQQMVRAAQPGAVNWVDIQLRGEAPPARPMFRRNPR